MGRLIRHAFLAPELAGRRLKHTSEQGRSRRMQLLAATRQLLCDFPPEELTFAAVCARAGIPRASAYHFFPNIEALLLGLRLSHAETLLEAIVAVEVDDFACWQDYLLSLIEAGAQVIREDRALTRLIYGGSGSTGTAPGVGKVLDAKIATHVGNGVRERFGFPASGKHENLFAIAFAIIDAVFRLSFRTQGEISDGMVQEAGRAATAYLSGYLPQYQSQPPNLSGKESRSASRTSDPNRECPPPRSILASYPCRQSCSTPHAQEPLPQKER